MNKSSIQFLYNTEKGKEFRVRNTNWLLNEALVNKKSENKEKNGDKIDLMTENTA